MSTYLDLPFTASLVALLILSRLSIWLDLQLWCQFDYALTLSLMFTWLDLHLWCQAKMLQIQLSWDFGLFENFDLVWILPFSPRRSFWSFYRVHEHPHSASLFQTRRHIFDAMCYAMYDHEWHVWVFNLFFFSFEFILFLCFRILCFSSPMCSLQACSSSLSCFYPLFEKHLHPWRLLVNVTTFSVSNCDSSI